MVYRRRIGANTAGIGLVLKQGLALPCYIHFKWVEENIRSLKSEAGAEGEFISKLRTRHHFVWLV